MAIKIKENGPIKTIHLISVDGSDLTPEEFIGYKDAEEQIADKFISIEFAKKDDEDVAIVTFDSKSSYILDIVTSRNKYDSRIYISRIVVYCGDNKEIISADTVAIVPEKAREITSFHNLEVDEIGSARGYTTTRTEVEGTYTIDKINLGEISIRYIMSKIGGTS